MKTISYAITACNEHVELDKLLTQLSSCKRTIDEIIVQLDITATQEVKDVVSKHKLISYVYPLNNDFSTFKNNLKSLCSKDYIFQIDADEYLSDQLMEYVAFIIHNNDVDMYMVPRINTVEGLTQEHIQKWGWRVSGLSGYEKESILDLDKEEDLKFYTLLKTYSLIIEESELS